MSLSAISLLTCSADRLPMAAFLDICLPAPWHEDPNVCSMDPLRPARTYVPTLMSPGMMTGCPTSLYFIAISLRPGANALVAPFLWTSTSSWCLSISWRSFFAILWATS